MNPSATTSIGPLDADDERATRAVADLHVAGFPETTEARFGLPFLTRVYYGALVRDGLLGCHVARRDGEVVAFISYTRVPRRLLTLAARRRPMLLARTLLRAALARPAAAGALETHLRAALPGASSSTGGAAIDSECGEVLLLIAKPEHQAWVPPGGRARVTVRLFAAMEAYFRRHGRERVLLLVRKNNTASNLFCHSMGCRIAPSASDSVYNHFWYEIRSASA